MKSYARAAVAVLLSLTPTITAAWARPAEDRPMSFTLEPDGTIVATGVIDEGAPSRFEAFLAENRERVGEGATVRLSSPGGSLWDGVLLGTMIYERRLNTSVGTPRPTGGGRPIRVKAHGKKREHGRDPFDFGCGSLYPV